MGGNALAPVSPTARHRLKIHGVMNFDDKTMAEIAPGSNLPLPLHRVDTTMNFIHYF